MDRHTHCRGQLKLAWGEAREKGIGILMLKSQKMHNDQYAVFCDHVEFDYQEYTACCAFDARAQFIYDYIDFKEKEE
jgi:hypothetical protein